MAFALKFDSIFAMARSNLGFMPYFSPASSKQNAWLVDETRTKGNKTIKIVLILSTGDPHGIGGDFDVSPLSDIIAGIDLPGHAKHEISEFLGDDRVLA